MRMKKRNGNRIGERKKGTKAGEMGRKKLEDKIRRVRGKRSVKEGKTKGRKKKIDRKKVGSSSRD